MENKKHTHDQMLALTPFDGAQYARLLKLASVASIVTASILILLKFFAFYSTNSTSIMASLIDSFMDVGASIINLLAIRVALQPADSDHAFGHGKAEAIAGLVQAAFIAGSACFLMVEAVERVLHPSALVDVSVGLQVMGLSIALTLLLVAFQAYVILKTNSTVIKADSLHYVSDVLSNAAVLLALFLSVLGYIYADAVVGALIGLVIIYGAVKIAMQSINILMDKALEPEELELFYDIILRREEVLGVHDLRSRRSGPKIFLQFHLELPDDISLKEAHVIADKVESDIVSEFGNVEVLIHEDPVGEINADEISNRRTKID